jgi:predicted N-acetyltransferase YhbS
MNITYQINPPLENAAMNALFASAWGRPYAVNFQPELEAAFLLDPSVDADYKRRGIGRELVARAVAFAREHGCEWVHVDFDDELEPFYAACGFRPTKAGLIQL